MENADGAMNFEVGNTIDFGKSKWGPYQWIILKVENDKTLIITKEIVKCRPYDSSPVDAEGRIAKKFSTTWEHCTLRNYLNLHFYNNTFTPEEQSKILSVVLKNEDNPSYKTPGGNDSTDKIFILSASEAKAYFKNDASRKNTWRSKEQNWWLRTPGATGEYAATVSKAGKVGTRGGYAFMGLTGIRPALWLSL